METLYADNRADWKKWLNDHFRSKEEIWLVCPKLSSGKKRILYKMIRLKKHFALDG